MREDELAPYRKLCCAVIDQSIRFLKRGRTAKAGSKLREGADFEERWLKAPRRSAPWFMWARLSRAAIVGELARRGLFRL